MKIATFLNAVLSSGLLVGCAVGPKYHRPAVQTPNAFRDVTTDSQQQAQAASYADLPWWQVFHDPKLQELIRTALKQNYDLQLATERINAARSQVFLVNSWAEHLRQHERQTQADRELEARNIQLPCLVRSAGLVQPQILRACADSRDRAGP